MEEMVSLKSGFFFIGFITLNFYLVHLCTLFSLIYLEFTSKKFRYTTIDLLNTHPKANRTKLRLVSFQVMLLISRDKSTLG